MTAIGGLPVIGGNLPAYVLMSCPAIRPPRAATVAHRIGEPDDRIALSVKVEPGRALRLGAYPNVATIGCTLPRPYFTDISAWTVSRESGNT
jgi:hypothetical protein